MGLRNLFEGWLLTKAIQKGAKVAAGVIGSVAVLQQAGVNVDVHKFETWLTAAGTALVAMALNYLKVKTKIGAKLL